MDESERKQINLSGQATGRAELTADLLRIARNRTAHIEALAKLDKEEKLLLVSQARIRQSSERAGKLGAIMGVAGAVLGLIAVIVPVVDLVKGTVTLKDGLRELATGTGYLNIALVLLLTFVGATILFWPKALRRD